MIKVRELMNTNPVTLNLQDKIQTVVKFFAQYKIGSIVITRDNNKPFQILTLRDLPKILLFQPPLENIDEALKKLSKNSKSLIVVSPSTSINETLSLMEKFEISHLPVVDKNKNLLGILSIKDIIKKFPEIVYIDTLTGVYNRAYLNFLNTKFKRLKNSATVLMIDIDNFKNVNDLYGHSTGDLVLKKVAQTIRNSIKTTDDLIRYGGEEFLVIAYRCRGLEGKILGERLRKNIEKIRIKNIPECKITVSIGIAIHDPEEEISETIENADIAMYTAKKLGKNRVEFFLVKL